MSSDLTPSIPQFTLQHAELPGHLHQIAPHILQTPPFAQPGLNIVPNSVSNVSPNQSLASQLHQTNSLLSPQSHQIMSMFTKPAPFELQDRVEDHFPNKSQKDEKSEFVSPFFTFKHQPPFISGHSGPSDHDFDKNGDGNFGDYSEISSDNPTSHVDRVGVTFSTHSYFQTDLNQSIVSPTDNDTWTQSTSHGSTPPSSQMVFNAQQSHQHHVKANLSMPNSLNYERYLPMELTNLNSDELPNPEQIYMTTPTLHNRFPPSKTLTHPTPSIYPILPDQPVNQLNQLHFNSQPQANPNDSAVSNIQLQNQLVVIQQYGVLLAKLIHDENQGISDPGISSTLVRQQIQALVLDYTRQKQLYEASMRRKGLKIPIKEMGGNMPPGFNKNTNIPDLTDHKDVHIHSAELKDSPLQPAVNGEFNSIGGLDKFPAFELSPFQSLVSKDSLSSLIQHAEHSHHASGPIVQDHKNVSTKHPVNLSVQQTQHEPLSLSSNPNRLLNKIHHPRPFSSLNHNSHLHNSLKPSPIQQLQQQQNPSQLSRSRFPLNPIPSVASINDYVNLDSDHVPLFHFHAAQSLDSNVPFLNTACEGNTPLNTITRPAGNIMQHAKAHQITPLQLQSRSTPNEVSRITHQTGQTEVYNDINPQIQRNQLLRLNQSNSRFGLNTPVSKFAQPAAITPREPSFTTSYIRDSNKPPRQRRNRNKTTNDLQGQTISINPSDQAKLQQLYDLLLQLTERVASYEHSHNKTNLHEQNPFGDPDQMFNANKVNSVSIQQVQSLHSHLLSLVEQIQSQSNHVSKASSAHVLSLNLHQSHPIVSLFQQQTQSNTQVSPSFLAHNQPRNSTYFASDSGPSSHLHQFGNQSITNSQHLFFLKALITILRIPQEHLTLATQEQIQRQFDQRSAAATSSISPASPEEYNSSPAKPTLNHAPVQQDQYPSPFASANADSTQNIQQLGTIIALLHALSTATQINTESVTDQAELLQFLVQLAQKIQQDAATRCSPLTNSPFNCEIQDVLEASNLVHKMTAQTEFRPLPESTVNLLPNRTKDSFSAIVPIQFAEPLPPQRSNGKQTDATPSSHLAAFPIDIESTGKALEQVTEKRRKIEKQWQREQRREQRRQKLLPQPLDFEQTYEYLQQSHDASPECRSHRITTPNQLDDAQKRLMMTAQAFSPIKTRNRSIIGPEQAKDSDKFIQDRLTVDLNQHHFEAVGPETKLIKDSHLADSRVDALQGQCGDFLCQLGNYPATQTPPSQTTMYFPKQTQVRQYHHPQPGVPSNSVQAALGLKNLSPPSNTELISSNFETNQARHVEKPSESPFRDGLRCGKLFPNPLFANQVEMNKPHHQYSGLEPDPQAVPSFWTSDTTVCQRFDGNVCDKDQHSQQSQPNPNQQISSSNETSISYAQYQYNCLSSAEQVNFWNKVFNSLRVTQYVHPQVQNVLLDPYTSTMFELSNELHQQSILALLPSINFIHDLPQDPVASTVKILLSSSPCSSVLGKDPLSDSNTIPISTSLDPLPKSTKETNLKPCSTSTPISPDGEQNSVSILQRSPTLAKRLCQQKLKIKNLNTAQGIVALGIYTSFYNSRWRKWMSANYFKQFVLRTVFKHHCGSVITNECCSIADKLIHSSSNSVHNCEILVQPQCSRYDQNASFSTQRSSPLTSKLGFTTFNIQQSPPSKAISRFNPNNSILQANPFVQHLCGLFAAPDNAQLPRSYNPAAKHAFSQAEGFCQYEHDVSPDQIHDSIKHIGSFPAIQRSETHPIEYADHRELFPEPRYSLFSVSTFESDTEYTPLSQTQLNPPDHGRDRDYRSLRAGRLQQMYHVYNQQIRLKSIQLHQCKLKQYYMNESDIDPSKVNSQNIHNPCCGELNQPLNDLTVVNNELQWEIDEDHHHAQYVIATLFSKSSFDFPFQEQQYYLAFAPPEQISKLLPTVYFDFLRRHEASILPTCKLFLSLFFRDEMILRGFNEPKDGFSLDDNIAMRARWFALQKKRYQPMYDLFLVNNNNKPHESHISNPSYYDIDGLIHESVAFKLVEMVKERRKTIENQRVYAELYTPQQIATQQAPLALLKQYILQLQILYQLSFRRCVKYNYFLDNNEMWSAYLTVYRQKEHSTQTLQDFLNQTVSDSLPSNDTLNPPGSLLADQLNQSNREHPHGAEYQQDFDSTQLGTQPTIDDLLRLVPPPSTQNSSPDSSSTKLTSSSNSISSRGSETAPSPLHPLDLYQIEDQEEGSSRNTSITIDIDSQYRNQQSIVGNSQNSASSFGHPTQVSQSSTVQGSGLNSSSSSRTYTDFSSIFNKTCPSATPESFKVHDSCRYSVEPPLIHLHSFKYCSQRGTSDRFHAQLSFMQQTTELARQRFQSRSLKSQPSAEMACQENSPHLKNAAPACLGVSDTQSLCDFTPDYDGEDEMQDGFCPETLSVRSHGNEKRHIRPNPDANTTHNLRLDEVTDDIFSDDVFSDNVSWDQHSIDISLEEEFQNRYPLSCRCTYDESMHQKQYINDRQLKMIKVTTLRQFRLNENRKKLVQQLMMLAKKEYQKKSHRNFYKYAIFRYQREQKDDLVHLFEYAEILFQLQFWSKAHLYSELTSLNKITVCDQSAFATVNPDNNIHPSDYYGAYYFVDNHCVPVDPISIYSYQLQPLQQLYFKHWMKMSKLKQKQSVAHASTAIDTSNETLAQSTDDIRLNTMFDAVFPTMQTFTPQFVPVQDIAAQHLLHTIDLTDSAMNYSTSYAVRSETGEIQQIPFQQLSASPLASIFDDSSFLSSQSLKLSSGGSTTCETSNFQLQDTPSTNDRYFYDQFISFLDTTVAESTFEALEHNLSLDTNKDIVFESEYETRPSRSILSLMNSVQSILTNPVHLHACDSHSAILASLMTPRRTADPFFTPDASRPDINWNYLGINPSATKAYLPSFLSKENHSNSLLRTLNNPRLAPYPSDQFVSRSDHINSSAAKELKHIHNVTLQYGNYWNLFKSHSDAKKLAINYPSLGLSKSITTALDTALKDPNEAESLLSNNSGLLTLVSQLPNPIPSSSYLTPLSQSQHAASQQDICVKHDGFIDESKQLSFVSISQSPAQLCEPYVALGTPRSLSARRHRHFNPIRNQIDFQEDDASSFAKGSQSSAEYHNVDFFEALFQDEPWYDDFEICSRSPSTSRLSDSILSEKSFHHDRHCTDTNCTISFQSNLDPGLSQRNCSASRPSTASSVASFESVPSSNSHSHKNPQEPELSHPILKQCLHEHFHTINPLSTQQQMYQQSWINQLLQQDPKNPLITHIFDLNQISLDPKHPILQIPFENNDPFGNKPYNNWDGSALPSLDWSGLNLFGIAAFYYNANFTVMYAQYHQLLVDIDNYEEELNAKIAVRDNLDQITPIIDDVIASSVVDTTDKTTVDIQHTNKNLSPKRYISHWTGGYHAGLFGIPRQHQYSAQYLAHLARSIFRLLIAKQSNKTNQTNPAQTTDISYPFCVESYGISTLLHSPSNPPTKLSKIPISTRKSQKSNQTHKTDDVLNFTAKLAKCSPLIHNLNLNNQTIRNHDNETSSLNPINYTPESTQPPTMLRAQSCSTGDNSDREVTPLPHRSLEWPGAERGRLGVDTQQTSLGHNVQHCPHLFEQSEQNAVSQTLRPQSSLSIEELHQSSAQLNSTIQQAHSPPQLTVDTSDSFDLPPVLTDFFASPKSSSDCINFNPQHRRAVTNIQDSSLISNCPDLGDYLYSSNLENLVQYRGLAKYNGYLGSDWDIDRLSQSVRTFEQPGAEFSIIPPYHRHLDVVSADTVPTALSDSRQTPKLSLNPTKSSKMSLKQRQPRASSNSSTPFRPTAVPVTIPPIVDPLQSSQSLLQQQKLRVLRQHPCLLIKPIEQHNLDTLHKILSINPISERFQTQGEHQAHGNILTVVKHAENVMNYSLKMAKDDEYIHHLASLQSSFDSSGNLDDVPGRAEPILNPTSHHNPFHTVDLADKWRDETSKSTLIDRLQELNPSFRLQSLQLPDIKNHKFNELLMRALSHVLPDPQDLYLAQTFVLRSTLPQHDPFFVPKIDAQSSNRELLNLYQRTEAQYEEKIVGEKTISRLGVNSSESFWIPMNLKDNITVEVTELRYNKRAQKPSKSQELSRKIEFEHFRRRIELLSSSNQSTQQEFQLPDNFIKPAQLCRDHLPLLAHPNVDAAPLPPLRHRPCFQSEQFQQFDNKPGKNTTSAIADHKAQLTEEIYAQNSPQQLSTAPKDVHVLPLHHLSRIQYSTIPRHRVDQLPQLNLSPGVDSRYWTNSYPLQATYPPLKQFMRLISSTSTLDRLDVHASCFYWFFNCALPIARGNLLKGYNQMAPIIQQRLQSIQHNIDNFSTQYQLQLAFFERYHFLKNQFATQLQNYHDEMDKWKVQLSEQVGGGDQSPTSPSNLGMRPSMPEKSVELLELEANYQLSQDDLDKGKSPSPPKHGFFHVKASDNHGLCFNYPSVSYQNPFTTVGINWTQRNMVLAPPLANSISPFVYPFCYIDKDKPAYLHLLIYHNKSLSKISHLDPTGMRIAATSKEHLKHDILTVRSRIARGRENFVQVIQSRCDCPYTASLQGVISDWDLIPSLHPNLKTRVKDLQLGEVSTVYLSALGLHIVQKIYDGCSVMDKPDAELDFDQHNPSAIEFNQFISIPSESSRQHINQPQSHVVNDKIYREFIYNIEEDRYEPVDTFITPQLLDYFRFKDAQQVEKINNFQKSTNESTPVPPQSQSNKTSPLLKLQRRFQIRFTDNYYHLGIKPTRFKRDDEGRSFIEPPVNLWDHALLSRDTRLDKSVLLPNMTPQLLKLSASGGFRADFTSYSPKSQTGVDLMGLLDAIVLTTQDSSAKSSPKLYDPWVDTPFVIGSRVQFPGLSRNSMRIEVNPDPIFTARFSPNLRKSVEFFKLDDARSNRHVNGNSQSLHHDNTQQLDDIALISSVDSNIIPLTPFSPHYNPTNGSFPYQLPAGHLQGYPRAYSQAHLPNVPQPSSLHLAQPTHPSSLSRHENSDWQQTDTGQFDPSPNHNIDHPTSE